MIFANTPVPINQSLAPKEQDPVSKQVLARYGDTQRMMRRFDIDSQSVLASNIERYMRVEAPYFPAMVRAYGMPNMAILMARHLTDALVFRGDEKDMDEVNINNTALGLCDIARMSTLTMASVIAFFYYFKLGRFKVFGQLTPAKVFEIFRQYAESARDKERGIYDTIQREKEIALNQPSPDSYDGWEKLCRAHGFPPMKSGSELMYYYGQMQKTAEAFAYCFMVCATILAISYNSDK